MLEPLETTRNRLLAKLQRQQRPLKRNDDYFEGVQPLQFMSQTLKAELGERVTELVINLPRYFVEVYDTLLDVEGFRYSGQDSTDDELWSIFQQNDGDNLYQQTHQEALAISRSYMIVGPGTDPQVPLITAESGFQCIHEDDPTTHSIMNGIKRWTMPDRSNWVSLYTPQNQTTYVRTNGEWTEDSQTEYDVELNRMTPLMHRPRALGRYRPGRTDERLGRSVFHDLIPIMDAVNKMATDMMVSGEFHGMPRRWAIGLNPDDFSDELGNAIGTWEMMVGRIWASENDKAKMGQFEESDLKVFHDSIKLLIQIATQMLGLPTNFLAFNAQNPPSSDAIRASSNQMVKRAERMQTVFGGAHNRVQRLVLLELTGVDEPAARQIETLWRDPSTPTIAQQADATVKLKQASIIPVQQAREDLGYTAVQQKRMEDWDKENAALDPLANSLRGLPSPIVDLTGALDPAAPVETAVGA